MDMRAHGHIEASFIADSERAAAGWSVSNATWTERLSQPYVVTADLAHADREAEAMPLLGQSVELVLARRGVEARVAGIVSEVREGVVRQSGAHAVLTIEPALAAARHRKNSRIFQDKTVPAILEEVLGDDLGAFGRNLSVALGREYPPREYTVQYEETDFDFVHRLMEEEGITYFFRHDGGPELMTLVDSPSGHSPIECETGSTLSYLDAWGSGGFVEGVHVFEAVGRMTGTAVATRSFDWTHPSMPLEASAEGGGTGPVLESYEARAPVTLGGFGDTGYTTNDVAAQTGLQREAQGRDAQLAEGLTTSLGARCGSRFVLTGHPRLDLNRDYVFVSVTHRYLVPGDSPEGAPDDLEYVNHVSVGAAESAWRPERTRDRPRIHGVQTATVVGPGEIHTDRHGRVKVHFHWDRQGGGERSSCWIRVLQALAGPGWGFTFVPRVGQEVAVTFIDGDPDKPLVTGAVFNGNHPLPLDYPANKTQMTIKSSSSPGGAGYNELRFEDKAGAEEIWLHGQRDWNTVIEHDLTRRVGHDEAQEVVQHRSRRVGGNETVRIAQNQTRQVDMNETEVVGMNRTRTVNLVESVMIGVDRNAKVGQNENVDIGQTASRQIGLDLVEKIGQHAVQEVGRDVARTIGNDETVQIGNDQSIDVVRDRSTQIGNDETTSVGHDHTLTIGGSSTETVKKDASRSVRGHDELSVGKSQKVSVGRNQNLQVAINQMVKVGVSSQVIVGGPAILGVGAAYQVNVGGKMTVTAQKAFKVECGKSSFEMDAEGKISIKGTSIEITADGGDVVVAGDKIRLN